MQRARIVLIFAAVAALLGGVLYYLFGVHLPGKARAGARSEVVRWEERLDKARRCLLGQTPVSSVNAQQLAIFELANDVVDRRSCTPLISALARGDGVDTEIREVEEAWRGVESAISAVVGGFASKLDPGGDATRGTDKLALALDKLDAARDALHEAAFGEPPASTILTPLRKATLIPLDDKVPVTQLDGWLRPSAGGVVALARANDKRRQLVLVPGGSPRIDPLDVSLVRSITDPALAATYRRQIRVGPITGDLGGADVVPTAAAMLPEVKGATPLVLFALGGPADGLIAYVPETEKGTPQTGIARLSGTALVPEPLHDAAHYAFALSPPNRGLLAWSSRGALEAAIVTPGTPTKIVPLGSGDPGQSCLTATHGWVSSPPQFVSFDDNGARPHLLTGDYELIGCDETSVLLRGAGHRYAICTHENCRLVELMARPLAMPALSGGQAIAVASRRGVLGVWREKGPPIYFGLPQAMQIKLVHATAKQIDVIGETDKGFAIARLAL